MAIRSLKAGMLRSRAVFYSAVKVRNNEGGLSSGTWEQRFVQWAHLGEAGAFATYPFNLVRTSESLTLTTRHTEAAKLIKNGWAVEVEGKTFNITGIRNLEGKEEYLQLDVKETGPLYNPNPEGRN